MTVIDLTGHPHLLGNRLPVYATMNGLVGGGWELPPEAQAWCEANRIKVKIRIRVEDDRPITFADYSGKNAEAVFSCPDDAFYFKMALL